MKKNDKLPNIHPEEVLLEEFLKPMAISQNALVRAIDVPPRRINEIVLKKRAIYSQELLNNLFFYPYTKVQFVVDQLGVSRITASKYLNQLAGHGFVKKHKIGRTNYYVNEALVRLITR